MITALSDQMKSCELKPSSFLLIAMATGTAVQASSTSLQFTRATFYGYKAVSATAAPTANGADVQMGYNDAAGSVVAAASPVFLDIVGAGGSQQMTAGPGRKYDLKDIYFLGATGDKILIAYEQ